jgi:hypothetical protein
MSEAQRRLTEQERLIRELVDNDPLFSTFTAVLINDPGSNDGQKLVLVRREDGAGIQMPEPGAA